MVARTNPLMSRTPSGIGGAPHMALEEQDFLARLRRAGLEDPSVAVTNVYDGSAGNSMCGAPPMPDGVRLISGFVRATKPRG